MLNGVNLDHLDHRNFEQARQLIETKGEEYFVRAVVSIGHALKALYGGQPVSLQRLAATFRRGDLLGYLL